MTASRKKLHQDILLQYPDITSEALRQYLPLKDQILYKVRISTYKNIQVNVYMVENTPTFFKIDYDDNLYPTVFTLWQWKNLIPVYTTFRQVWPRICNGADLMGPGVITFPEAMYANKWGNFPAGCVVGISLTDNESVCAIGTTVVSSDEMHQSKGSGKCVKILHWYTDQLWALTPIKIPDLGQPKWLSDRDLTYEAIRSPVDERVPDPSIHIVPVEDEEESKEQPKSKEESQHFMDSLLKYCLCKIIKFCSKSIKLPILSSNFYRNYMVAAVPPSCELNIKQSTYKKFSLFLKQMQIDGLIAVVEEKSVQSIRLLNETHPDVRTFQLWENDDADCNPTTEDSSIPPPPPQLTDYYSVTMPVMKIFNPEGFSRGDKIPAKEIRKYVTLYVKFNNLAKKDKVLTDLYLKELMKLKETVEVSYPDLIEAVTKQMTPYHGTSNEKMDRGKSKPIQMSVQTRTGNKKVTLIDNLDMFNIDTKLFAKTCQQTVGASASVIPVQINGKKINQVMVQGNQINFVFKILTGKF